MKSAIPFLMVLLLAPHAEAAKPRELSVVTDFRFAKDPLTTDRIGTLDPTEPNPHRQRWVLERHVELKGLRPETRAEGRHGVRIEGVESLAKGWTRGPGPWYRPLADFGCAARPDPYFATVEGTRMAAEAGAKRWDELLRQSRDQLRILLSRVVAATPGLALLDANQALADWVATLDRQWRAESLSAVRAEEWKTYLASAKEKGLCPGQGKKKAALSWRDVMEPPPAPLAPGTGTTQILARAPARRWNGMYSVRVTVRVGATRSLSGQFLVDTSAPRTIFDPDWLKGQGVLPTWLEIPRAAPEIATFAGGRSLARRAHVESIELAGYRLPINEVLLRDTEIFSPPDHLAVCCDGVLGMDVLRRVVAEFRTRPPAELILWPREGFRAPYGVQSIWIEAGLEQDLQPVSSSCRAEPAVEGDRPELSGVRWSTASEGALAIHPPWQSKASGRRAAWGIFCDQELEIADGILPDSSDGEDSARLGRFPAVTAGMALLGRSGFIFDFPHGRIWFPAPALTMPVRENRTGLTVIYDYAQGERVLRVAGVRPTPILKPLIRAGLATGSQILEVDARPVDETDLWEIDQRLGGAYGKSVELRWKAGRQVKQMKIALEGQEP
jgi:hypothetical protein